MLHFVNKKINAGYIYQVRAADAIPHINFSLPYNGYFFNSYLTFEQISGLAQKNGVDYKKNCVH